jgi:hypothetical protein
MSKSVTSYWEMFRQDGTKVSVTNRNMYLIDEGPVNFRAVAHDGMSDTLAAQDLSIRVVPIQDRRQTPPSDMQLWARITPESREWRKVISTRAPESGAALAPGLYVAVLMLAESTNSEQKMLEFKLNVADVRSI